MGIQVRKKQKGYLQNRVIGISTKYQNAVGYRAQREKGRCRILNTGN